MKRFNYKAKTWEGKGVYGIVEGLNLKDAVKNLRERKLIPIGLKERGSDSLSALLATVQGVSSKDVSDFTRQLATMITAGLSLTNSLVTLRDQSKPAMAKILADVVKEIEGGSSFTDALAKHPNTFNKIYLALIKSGEASGSLDDVLRKMADSLEKSQEFIGKVKGAMVYPMIVITGMIGVITIMMIFVIPKLTVMYQDFGTTLPLPTRILIGLSSFMANFWYICLGLLVGAIVGFRKWKQTPKGSKTWDRLMLNLPVLGVLNRKVILTTVCRTLSMLLGAGVTIIEALNIVGTAAGNSIFEESIKNAAADVEKGLPLTTTFGRYEEYPSIFTQMVAVGEETGKLDEVLLRLSTQFEMESEQAIKGLTTAIEPLMMIILGVGVGFLVFSIITPIYNLTSQF